MAREIARIKLNLPCSSDRRALAAVKDMAAYFGIALAGAAEPCDAEMSVNISSQELRAIICHENREYIGQSYLHNNTSGEFIRCVKLAVVRALSQLTDKRPEMPWGVLTGVRPGKLAHKLWEELRNINAVKEKLCREYLLPEQSSELLTRICALQERVAPKNEVGLYIGIPFCPTICSYCSFPSALMPRSEEFQENFLKLIELDLRNVVQLLSMHSLQITSLYIGGGTPTSFSDKMFAHFMNIVRRHVPWSNLREFTVEAGRPDCFSLEKLQAMEAAGVSRVSVNPQTFHDGTLKRIGRGHTIADFYHAYEMVKESSIPIVNMDLIIGLPGESEKDIEFSLQRAAALKPDNLTVHTLTLKKNAELFKKSAEVSLEPETAARMVDLGMQTALSLGMQPYYLYRQHYMLGHLANIGYALPGTESVYNIQMMEERHIVMAVGPSSSSKVPLADGHNLQRHVMPKNITVYENTMTEQFAKRAALLV